MSEGKVVGTIDLGMSWSVATEIYLRIWERPDDCSDCKEYDRSKESQEQRRTDIRNLAESKQNARDHFAQISAMCDLIDENYETLPQEFKDKLQAIRAKYNK